MEGNVHEICCSILSDHWRDSISRAEFVSALQAFGTRLVAYGKRSRRSAEIWSLRWLQYRLGQAELYRYKSHGGPEASCQASGNGLSSRTLPGRSGCEFTVGTAARPAGDEQRQRTGPMAVAAAIQNEPQTPVLA